MRLGVLATIGRDWKAAVERVRIAEDLGYEHVATGEAWGPSALPFLALIAANTSRITFGTAIVNCFSRSPAVLAQELAMLDQIYEEGLRTRAFRDDPVEPLHVASAVVGTSVFFIAAIPNLLPRHDFDPLEGERLEAHRRELLTIVRRSLGLRAPRLARGANS